MTEFVFSMNYFFWLLAFKDGSFSDGLKQGLLGAGLRSLAFPLLLKAKRGALSRELYSPSSSLPVCFAAAFSSQNKPRKGGLRVAG